MSSRRFRLGTESVLLVRRSALVPVPHSERRAHEYAAMIVESGQYELRPGESRAEAVARLARQLEDGSLRLIRTDEPERLRGRPTEAAPLLSELEEPVDAVVEPRTWVGVRVVDQHGFPVPHLRVEFTLPDGEQVDKALDAAARARIDGIRGEDGEFDVKLTPPPLVPK